jgi:prevent-host-death family protein
MSATWQLQQAKNRLSEVVRKAQTEGPQTITVRGEETAVVISIDEYRKTHPKPKEETLYEFFRRSPLWGAEDIEIEIDDPPYLPRVSFEEGE